jgi:hypothetical protein
MNDELTIVVPVFNKVESLPFFFVDGVRAKAELAMVSIGHVKDSFWKWFECPIHLSTFVIILELFSYLSSLGA